MEPLGDRDRVPGQTFESCPAATGEPPERDAGCRHFPDGGHRCGLPREPHPNHHCTCGTVWTSAIHVALRPMGTARFRGETK